MDWMEILFMVLLMITTAYVGYSFGWRNGYSTCKKISEQMDKKIMDITMTYIRSYFKNCEENSNEKTKVSDESRFE